MFVSRVVKIPLECTVAMSANVLFMRLIYAPLVLVRRGVDKREFVSHAKRVISRKLPLAHQKP